MKRDFASLIPQEALHVAIFIEERNAQIYTQFSELFAEFKDPESLEIAQVFWEMATEERGHGTMLQDRYFERYGMQPCVVTEEDVRDMVELPRLENGELFATRHTGASPRRKALEIALQAERAALRFYTRMAEIATDPQLKAVYKELAEFEGDHTSFLQRKMAESQRAAGGES